MNQVKENLTKAILALEQVEVKGTQNLLNLGCSIRILQDLMEYCEKANAHGLDTEGDAYYDEE